MEARFIRLALCAAAIGSLGAGGRTANFIVKAPSPELAEEIAQAAEGYRREMALYWLGHELPDWSNPCPITAEVGQLGAGGVTSFIFDRGEVFGWEMRLQGTRERVLDSVLPHEVTHTIFASHFRQQLPRWADEGACTTVEHESERGKHQHLLTQFLQTGRGIAFNQMFRMKDYPDDILPLYSQGYALAQFLIGKKGPRAFVGYIEEGLKTGDWPAATKNHYGFDDLSALQDDWLAWVRRGLPVETPVEPVENDTPVRLASAAAPTRAPGGIDGRPTRPTPNLIYRAQNAAPARASDVVELVPIASTPAPSRDDGWRPPSPHRKMRPLSGRSTAAKTTDEESGDSVEVDTERWQASRRQKILEWSRDPTHAVR